jgi:hypothetical protein
LVVFGKLGKRLQSRGEAGREMIAALTSVIAEATS